jgi:hypothetical protein
MNNKSSKRNFAHNRRNNQTIDQTISNQLMSSSTANTIRVPQDTRRGTPSWNIIETPPRNFMRQIVWLSEEVGLVHNLSPSGAVVETNLGPLLSTFAASANIAALYDQYCIYAIKARFVLDQAGQTAGSAFPYGRIHSAIDLDSTGNLGTESAIQRYSTVQSAELTVGMSYERYCKPCVALVTGASNSASNTGIAMTRAWLNSVLTAVPHFGIRFLTVGNQNVTTNTGIIYLSAVIGVRNNV